MADLINRVENGKLVKNNLTNAVSGGNTLGKEAFLQLLAAQMKYQDPLNPNTDTQFVAQLATFAQLEQMQNLNSTTVNSQAFSLVGKYVVMNSKLPDGTLAEYVGRVDMVKLENGKVFFKVNDRYFNSADLSTVVDKTYLDEIGLPQVESKTLEYDKENDNGAVSFMAYFGRLDNKATKVTLEISGKIIDPKYVTIGEDKVTIDTKAFEGLEKGIYPIKVTFDDKNNTVVSEALKLKVVN